LKDVTADALRAIIGSKSAIRSNGGRLTQNSGRKGRPTNRSSYQKTRLNDLSYNMKIWTYLCSVLSQCTRLTDWQTDGRTDGQTDTFLIARPSWHSMQRRKKLFIRNWCILLEWVTMRLNHLGIIQLTIQKEANTVPAKP